MKMISKGGAFWILLGLTIVICDTISPTFTIKLGSIHFSPGILAVLYGVLLTIGHNITMSKIKLSDDEVAEYGATLEKVTPQIIEMLKQRQRVKHIAGRLSKSDGLPEHITMRYIIALMAQLRAEKGT